MPEGGAHPRGPETGPRPVVPPVRPLPLGRLLVTAGVLAGGLSPATLAGYLARHARGDWGELDAEDRTANRRALAQRERVLSSYTHEGLRFWVLTEADRSATTVLLPEEY